MKDSKAQFSAQRRRRGDLPLFALSLCVLSQQENSSVAHGFVQNSQTTTALRSFRTASSCRLDAKRKNRKDSADDANSWYDAVDDKATADDVFWEEMERQRLVNQIGSGDVSREIDMMAALSSPSTTQSSNQPTVNGGSGMPPTNPGQPGLGIESVPVDGAPTRKAPTMEQQKSAEATLSEYTLFQQADNWLDETLQSQFDPLNLEQLVEELTIAEETARLEEQLEELPDGIGPGSLLFDDNEPWEHWGADTTPTSETVDRERASLLTVEQPSPDSEFYFDMDSTSDELNGNQHEDAFREKMKDCKVFSRRAARAMKSENAVKFFQRPPNAREGYDQLWVSAIDNACVKSLVGNFRNYGVEFADNFGDFEDGKPEDSLYSIEDIASYKARKVFEATGLPCIASRSSFEVEPIPPANPTYGQMPSVKANPAMGINNPKVLSGYRIGDIGMHVDYICEALRPMSEPTRVTRFTSCLCYYDGEIEIFEHGICDVDIHFSNSKRTFIPMGQAINSMLETLKLTFGLQFQKFLTTRLNDANRGALGSASLKLRDRVLKDGQVLPNDIIDVSKFMDSQVDVNLMDDCAKELANRFMNEKPTKIMTVATTGLVIALPMAKYLQVPVVYARKERNVVMADTYKAGYSSKTVGKNRELMVSKSHVHPDDRVLVIDDFLSSGASQEALLRIISDAEATAVGVGVLLEKSYESGRQSLSGFNIPIHSLCRVASVQNGSIQLVEEDGFEQK